LSHAKGHEDDYVQDFEDVSDVDEDTQSSLQQQRQQQQQRSAGTMSLFQSCRCSSALHRSRLLDVNTTTLSQSYFDCTAFVVDLITDALFDELSQEAVRVMTQLFMNSLPYLEQQQQRLEEQQEQQEQTIKQSTRPRPQPLSNIDQTSKSSVIADSLFDALLNEAMQDMMALKQIQPLQVQQRINPSVDATATTVRTPVRRSSDTQSTDDRSSSLDSPRMSPGAESGSISQLHKLSPSPVKSPTHKFFESPKAALVCRLL
jgi:hypothetical protein